MEINFGSRYQDTDGNVYKLVGKANPYSTVNPKMDMLLFAPISAGSVGDVFYITKDDADKNLFPVSKYF